MVTIADIFVLEYNIGINSDFSFVSFNISVINAINWRDCMKCPRCGSHRITHKISKTKKVLIDVGYLLAVIPGFLLERKWRSSYALCRECGFRWRKMNW